MQTRNIFLTWIGITFLFQSCSVAKFSSMPKGASEINFANFQSQVKNEKEPLLTGSTTNEYFIEINRVCNELELLDAIGQAYTANHYGFSKFNKADKAIFAERGARLNEWKSLAGIYYQINGQLNNTRFYILVNITQDITGGWKENRAKKLGLSLEKLLNKQ